MKAFFCGQEEFCINFGSEKALKTAKRNIERFYPVVGVLEMFEESMEVMEVKMPTFFTGLREAYKERFPHSSKGCH